VPFYQEQEQEQLDTREGMIDETLVNMGKWSPSLPNHPHKNGIPQEVSSKREISLFSKMLGLILLNYSIEIS
jgi:hypothetical protein